VRQLPQAPGTTAMGIWHQIKWTTPGTTALPTEKWLDHYSRSEQGSMLKASFDSKPY
jgi:hypothetical protein